eukprot:364772-Chlamydomonas_euryale.AAC.5
MPHRAGQALDATQGRASAGRHTGQGKRWTPHRAKQALDATQGKASAGRHTGQGKRWTPHRARQALDATQGKASAGRHTRQNKLHMPHKAGQAEGEGHGCHRNTRNASHLHIWVVACADGTHARGLVAGVRLRAVLKVRIRPTGAVDANVSCRSPDSTHTTHENRGTRTARTRRMKTGAVDANVSCRSADSTHTTHENRGSRCKCFLPQRGQHAHDA